MENKLKNHLEGLFGKATPSDAKDEIVAELYANLLEKYQDLLNAGKAPDEAYEEVVEGIGDVDEMISFINASSPRKDFDFGAAFEGFESRMRELAKDLETPFREVTQDLKNAAINARDAAIHAKEPLKEAVRQVGHEMKNVGKGLGDVVINIDLSQPGKNTFRYDYEVPAADIDSLNIEADSGKVTFGVSQNDSIYVVELARQALDEDKRAHIELRQNTLHISHGKSQVGLFFFGIGIFSSNFEIYLPKKLFESIVVSTTSGEIDLDVDLNAKSMKVKSSSGDIFGADIRCPDLNVHSSSGDVKINGMLSQRAEIHSTSGDLELGGEIFDAQFTTVSGDVEFTGEIRDLVLNTTSGDIELDGEMTTLGVKTVSGDVDSRLSQVPAELRIDTMSGDIKVSIPENDGFTLSYKRVSGDIKSDFNLLTSINSKDGHGIYRDGNLRRYSISTVSGDIRLLKR